MILEEVFVENMRTSGVVFIKRLMTMGEVKEVHVQRPYRLATPLGIKREAKKNYKKDAILV